MTLTLSEVICLNRVPETSGWMLAAPPGSESRAARERYLDASRGLAP